MEFLVDHMKIKNKSQLKSRSNLKKSLESNLVDIIKMREQVQTTESRLVSFRVSCTQGVKVNFVLIRLKRF